MGKRGATPKQAANANKRPKAMPAGFGGPPPKAAPEVWGRPAPSATAGEGLSFFLVDIEDEGQGSLSASEVYELRLYGVTAAGCSVCVKLRGLRPYFYVPCPPEAIGRENDIHQVLESALQSSLPPQLRSAPGGSPAVLRVELVRRTPVLVYQQEGDFLRVTVAGPRFTTPCVKALENGIRLPLPQDAAEGTAPVELQGAGSFEANVPSVLRFLVDHDLGGGRWLELAPASFSASPRKTTGAQMEVDLDLAQCQSDGSNVIRVFPLDTEAGSAIAPVRVASLHVLLDAESRLAGASCVLSVQGAPDSRPHARAVWLRRAPTAPAASTAGDACQLAPAWSEVTVEAYDPRDDTPAATVFCHENEDVLSEHLGETLALMDPDVVLCHDLTQTIGGLLGKKLLAKPGSGLVRGLCRRLAAEVKLTPKSNEIAGLAGRLGFDLQKQVEKDHRLTDYSLGSLSEHFCKAPMPELREAALSSLLSSRPRSYAKHVLRQAEACLRVFDHLAYLYNFVEMARVTGCPLGYLLERGQAVKVQAQLLSEARRRGFLLPSQRPGTGEESSFEGATVLEPSTGFYRSPVAVLDFASLYPSIMMAHNLCYSTLLPAGADKKPNAPKNTASPPTAVTEQNITGQAVCFVDASERRGLLPSILERLLSARKAAKRELAQCASSGGSETRRKVLNGRQLALKLSANSVYGFTGAMNGPLPCLELAGAVTAYGREMIMKTKQLVESHFVQDRGYAHNAEVLYGDTDSVMVRFGPEELGLADVVKLSEEAAKVCTAAFPQPVRLEFEKVYRPFLLMNKKRYAGLAWSSAGGTPTMETKGIETVRRDWSDLVRQGLEQTLHLLLRADGTDGTEEAVAYVRKLCDDLRQNRMDFRSLVISKSLGREDYATKLPHVEVAAKMAKRDPARAPKFGDRVAYLVLAGAAKAKLYEKAEEPLYALEQDLPVDADYYLENQLKQPLLRVFEHAFGSQQKADQALFAAGAGQLKVTAAPSSASGLGKFMKPKPKCLDCKGSAKGDKEPFCTLCEAKGEEHVAKIRQACVENAREVRKELEELKEHCRFWCGTPPGAFTELPPDASMPKEHTQETCPNSNCHVVFRRARAAKGLKSAEDALARLRVT